MSPRRLEDGERFAQALKAANADLSSFQGIGRLNEGSLHRTLKLYFEPDITRHEVKIGPFVADILNEDGITEIQTRAFQSMKKKLEAFLSVGRVRIVFPVAAKKDVVWLDPQTGELSAPHKSPKRGTAYDIFPELYKIRQFLSSPSLRIEILLMYITDVRLLCGWDESKKRGSHRSDRVPREILDILTLESSYDYLELFPTGLPKGEFTSKDFSAHTGIKPKLAPYALGVLREVGVVDVVGKNGRAYVYSASLDGR